MSHQEYERANITKFGGAPPLQFAKPIPEVGIEEVDPLVHQVKLKVNDDCYAYYNLFIKGPPELALNHTIIYLDIAKLWSLNNIAEFSNTLSKAKRADYNTLLSKRTKTSNKMEKEMKDLKEDVVDANKKLVFFFKQILHKTIQRE